MATPIHQAPPRDWTTAVAAVALLTLLAIVPLIFACEFGSHRAMSKSEGLWFGIGLFILAPAAIFGSLLSIPAIRRHPRLRWPYLGLVLGLLPVFLPPFLGKIERALRDLGLL